MKINEVKCDVCSKKFKNTTPPVLEAYESGLIQIAEGSTMLLPRAVVALNHKEGVPDVLAADLAGDYCSPACFIKKLNTVLHIEEEKKPASLDEKTAQAVAEADRRAKEREEKEKDKK